MWNLQRLTYILVCFSWLSVAHSLKCYKCTARSEEECSASQNVTTCDDRLRCAILTYDDHGFQYTKDCLWPTFCQGRQDNCTIKVCNEDYCNGPPPRTTAVKPSAACTGSSETPTTKLRVTKTAAPPIVLENNTAPLTKVLDTKAATSTLALDTKTAPSTKVPDTKTTARPTTRSH
ncbi:unnamed protein product, partial [Porites evermanni]